MTFQKTPDGQNEASRTRHDHVEGHKGLSSSTYVVGELDTSRRGEDGEWIQEIRRSAIVIRSASRCDHGETVCRDCAETWMFDWVFRFDRTAGGRRLRDELGGEKALVAMAERRTRAERAVAAGRDPAARPGEAHGSRPPGGPSGTGGGQRPVKPVYLSGTLTVEAELSAGRLYDGSTHAENASPVLAALVFIGGAAMLFTEDASGQLTRLRIPGPEFLRLTDDAAGRLARSRHQPDEPARRQGLDQ
jgi:hypothetical protein